MEKTVQVMSVSTVVPATYQALTIPRRIDLNPWDVVFLLTRPVQYGLLFDSSLVFESLQRLKESLSRTLDFFYPIAGRLCCIQDVSKDSSLFYIECNNGGVEFTHAITNDISVTDILQPVYNPSMMKLLFSRHGLLNIDCDHFLSVQVTELTDGGFFLGCTMSHCFGDGRSFWHFINSWTELCRGLEAPKNLPVIDRYYPGQTKIWISNELLSYKPPETIQNTSAYKKKIFILSKEKIALLKHNAIEETKNPKISSFQAIVSFLYTLISRTIQTNDKDVFMFFIPMGIRTRIQPPLSEYYLGNAIEVCVTIMTGEELRAIDALKCATSKVHDSIVSQSGTVIMETLESKIKKPVIIRATENNNYSSNDAKRNVLVVTNSPKFDVYGNDFGWGKPIAVRSGAVVQDGMITLYEGVENGSIQVDLSMYLRTFELLEKEVEFTRFFE